MYFQKNNTISQETPIKGIINLTPHELTVGGVNIPTSGTICRVNTTQKVVGMYGKIPIFHTEYGEVNGLPDPEDGYIYVVSSLCKSAITNRPDVMVVSNPIRDSKGIIIGCEGLSIS